MLLGKGQKLTRSGLQGVWNLVAFHPRPQIASDLGRNITRSSNLHLKSQAIPERERKFCLMAADSNRSRPQPAAI